MNFEYRSCPACYSNNRRNISEIIHNQFPMKTTKLIYDRRRTELSECLDCSLVYYSQAISRDTLNLLYRQHYRDEKKFYDEKRLLDNDSKCALFISIMKQFLQPKMRFLDIGCAEGFLLDPLKKMGLETLGIDLTENAVEFAKSKERNVIQGTIFDHHESIGKFDFVFTSGYFEHVFLPREELKIIRNILNPGGYLYIGTPNLHDPNQEFLHDFFPPEHLQTFSTKNLQWFCENNGFKMVKKRVDVYNRGMALIFQKMENIEAKKPEKIENHMDLMQVDWKYHLGHFNYWKEKKFLSELKLPRSNSLQAKIAMDALRNSDPDIILKFEDLLNGMKLRILSDFLGVT